MLQKMFNKLSNADKELFFFDVEQILWDQEITGHGYGLYKFILKENPDQESQFINRSRILKYAHYTLKYTFYAMIARFIFYYIFPMK